MEKKKKKGSVLAGHCYQGFLTWGENDTRYMKNSQNREGNQRDCQCLTKEKKQRVSTG